MGCSLFRSLRVLQNSQRVKPNIARKAANGVDVMSDVLAKPCGWHEHFELVSNISGNVDDETLDRLSSLTVPGEVTDRSSHTHTHTHTHMFPHTHTHTNT